MAPVTNATAKAIPRAVPVSDAVRSSCSGLRNAPGRNGPPGRGAASHRGLCILRCNLIAGTVGRGKSLRSSDVESHRVLARSP